MVREKEKKKYAQNEVFLAFLMKINQNSVINQPKFYQNEKICLDIPPPLPGQAPPTYPTPPPPPRPQYILYNIEHVWHIPKDNV